MESVHISSRTSSSKISPKKSVANKLDLIRWDFSDARADKNSIHGFHSYPARFIPQIPRSLINEISPPGQSLVFDPFCGCGTTLVEAQQAGYPSVGVDLNPIGCLISRVKTTPTPDGLIDDAIICAERARRSPILPIPDIPNLLHWFNPDVCQALGALRLALRDIVRPITKQALEGVFSSLIVRVSNQESDTRYAAIQKNVSSDDVYIAFVKTAKTLAGFTTAPTTALATVLTKSIFDVKPADLPGAVGLVITSPPYPNAYEYWLYHKYRMWWLGYDPLKVKSNEIGARAHFFSGRKEKEDFGVQMSAVFKLLSEVMLCNTYCCFVVGDSKIHGQIIDNAQILMEAALKFGFKLVFKCDREINPHRKSFNLHHARIKREHILVWER